MTDREKVINDLQDAVNDDWMWQHADYYAKAMEDALALIREQQEQLKAQTPVKPVKSKLSWEHGYNWDIWDCGHCGSQLRSDANYCDRCGKAVKWDE